VIPPKELHEARIIRDAEKADPGIVRGAGFDIIGPNLILSGTEHTSVCWISITVRNSCQPAHPHLLVSGADGPA
jgi:hypothetical protein